MTELNKEDKKSAADSLRNQTRPERIFLLILLILSLGAYFFIPSVHQSVRHIFTLLSSMDVEAVAKYIRSFGAWAMAISFALMILQSIAAPIPAFLLTFANAAIFGWWQGAILSWTSAMAGAAICFALARLFGRDAVVRLTSGSSLEQIDVFFERYGRNAILIMRLLPFISFDLVSYAAGLTSIGFWSFFIATGIGQLPATIIYSYVGGMLTGGTKLLVSGLLILFALSVLGLMIKKMYQARRDKSSVSKVREEDGE
ncbi:TVP38/TMEM64 family inner membrane protein YdjZ [anaerobic digester metagenome]